MAMIDLATAVDVINIILLLSLILVYAKNYLKLRSTFAICLVIFATMLLLQNLTEVYFHFAMVMFYTNEVASWAFAISVLEALGLAALAYITWKS